MVATALSSTLTTMQIYRDGVKVYQKSAGALGHRDDGGIELQTYVTMSAGVTHRVTVKGWDSSGSFSKTVYVTVK